MNVETEQRREPEARIPAYVLRCPEFAALADSGLALHVLLLLHAHARHGVAWCPQRRLATLSGSWRGSIQEALERLRAGGWIERVERPNRAPPKDKRRMADTFKLTLPASAEACRLEVNAALTAGGKGVTSPLWRDGDIFAYADGFYPREARVPLSCLSSEAFGTMRERGIALRLWLLLLALGNGKVATRIGKRSLAADLSVVPARITESLAYLRGDHPRSKAKLGPATGVAWLTTERDDTGNRPDRHLVRLVPRAAADVAPAVDTGPDDRAKFPPEHLVRQLSPIMRSIVEEWGECHAAGEWGDVPQAWAVLESEGLVKPAPPPDPMAKLSPYQAADWLVRAFHRTMRGAATYTPTLPEMRIARALVNKHGTRAVDLVTDAVRQMQATNFRAGNFAAVSRYIPPDA